MSKKDKTLIRQVRIYEEDARIVELILAAKGKSSTFADVINDALKRAYPEIVDKASAIIGEIEKALPDTDTGDN
jgi:hypothetical protein